MALQEVNKLLRVALSCIIVIDYSVSMIINSSHVMSLRRVNLD